MKGTVAILALAVLSVGAAASAQTMPPLIKCDTETVTAGDIRLPQAVLANGESLAAGTYRVRISTEHPKPAPGQSPHAECWVEFLKEGVVVGREVASVIPAEDIASVADGPMPALNQSRVDVLKGGDYVRVWMNRAGTNYLINLPAVQEPRE